MRIFIIDKYITKYTLRIIIHADTHAHKCTLARACAHRHTHTQIILFKLQALFTKLVLSKCSVYISHAV